MNSGKGYGSVCNFINKSFQYRCFTGNIAKFLRTTILKNNNYLISFQEVLPGCPFSGSCRLYEIFSEAF